MTPRIIAMILLGLGLWGLVVLERPLQKLKVAVPIVYVAFGWLVFYLPTGLPSLNVVSDPQHTQIAEYLTEFIVIASLMGAGLAIDRPLTWRGWKQVVPLIAVTMPLSIIAVSLLGWSMLGLAPAAAILLGAALSPTDPVLAETVQVGPPGEPGRHDVRFNLTVEAGVNDGLAFPFTYLAIAAVGKLSVGSWALEWFAFDFLWRIVAGVAVGVAVAATARAYVFRRMSSDDPGRLERHAGVIVMATLLVAYGIAEVIEGYGFLAVFVGAVVVRQVEPDSEFHERTHHFIDQLEDVVLVALLIGFGGLLANGILDALTIEAALVALAIVVLVRPVFGWLALLGSPLRPRGRAAVAFLGIRGMGSLYYLAYAQNSADFAADADVLWATSSAVILISLVAHGLTAERILCRIQRTGSHTHVAAEPGSNTTATLT